MRAWPHLWWQKIKQHPFRWAILIGGGLLVIGLIVAFLGGYFFNWDWTGFSHKKLWDWLQPLIIPVGLAAGGYLFALSISKSEQRIASDNQQQAALQAYFDKMSELLLHEHLGESPPPNEAVVVARARTATVLRTLNPSRCASLIQFLSQAGILRLCVENSAKSSFDWPLKNEYSLAGIELPETNFNCVDLSMIHLEGANLYRAFLRESNLEGTDLSGANMQKAILTSANLQKANLSGANLQDARLFMADLRGAVLSGTNLENTTLILANMSRANLNGANLTRAMLERANLKGVTGITVEQLEKQAKSLKGATMPDGSIYP